MVTHFWFLDDVVECDGIDKVVVSTDSKYIRSTVNLYKSDKILVIDKSDEVSTDTASTESVMLEFVQNYDFENIILVQATSLFLIKKTWKKDWKNLKIQIVFYKLLIKKDLSGENMETQNL